MRLLGSLPQPAKLLQVDIVVDGIRDLEAEVWAGVHDKLTSMGEPPMLHIEIFFDSQSLIDKYEPFVCSLFDSVMPFYHEVFSFELICPTGAHKYVSVRE